MSESYFFTDIHCHPTLRAYNTPVTHGQRNLWEKTYNPTYDSSASRWARMQTRDILKESQANLYNMARGGVRVIFDSLYPVEKGFLNFRKMASVVFGKKKADEVLHTITGIDEHQLKQLRRNGDYFQELLAQYAFLNKGQGKSPNGQYQYQLVANYDELQALVTQDPNAMAVVVTIEGAHAFHSGLNQGRRPALADMKRDLSQNIGITKSWKYPPFFVNLAHHFFNELCGHTRSFKPPAYSAFNQKRGLNKGILPAGWHALHEMLATDNGPRILIDIKHMSVRSRREYYQFIESYNRLNPSDRIPIICSHTGINDFATMKESIKKADKPGKNKNVDVHNWSINISAEEIQHIHRSGGIIGLMLDKGLLGSHTTLENIKKLSSPAEKKRAFLEIIARNIFGIVKAVGDKSGWNLLALGSDYDGLITHIDLYPDTTHIPNFRDDMVEFLKATGYEKEYWFGYEPEEMLRKILHDNTMEFLKTHFRRTPQLYSEPTLATIQ